MRNTISDLGFSEFAALKKAVWECLTHIIRRLRTRMPVPEESHLSVNVYQQGEDVVGGMKRLTLAAYLGEEGRMTSLFYTGHTLLPEGCGAADWARILLYDLVASLTCTELLDPARNQNWHFSDLGGSDARGIRTYGWFQLSLKK